MKLILSLILLVLIQAVINQAADKGAVKVRLTKKGINYAALIAVDMVSEKVRQMRIGDISGEKVASYWIWNIKVNSFSKLVPQISMVPGSGLRIKLRNNGLSVGANWRVKKWFVRLSGSVKATVSSVNLDFSVNIHSDSRGKPTLKAHSCKTSLGGFNVKVYGKGSSFYNFVLRFFKGKVRRTLEKSICDSATDTINNKGNKQLATLNLSSKVGKYLQLDYSLVGPPTFTGTYMETSHKGIFLNDPATSKVPLIGTPPHSMIGFSIAAESFNSAGRVLFAKKLLRKELKVPSIKSLLVTLDNRFANANIVVEVAASFAPTIKITKDLFTIKAKASVKLVGQVANGLKLDALKMNVGLEASVSVKIVNEKIIFQVKKVLPTAVVKISSIGGITQQFLNTFLEQTLKFARPSINKELNKGFPLPNINKVKFPNAAITLHPGYLSVSSDLAYRSK